MEGEEQDNTQSKLKMEDTEALIDIKNIDIPFDEFEMPQQNFAVIKVGNVEYRYVFNAAKSNDIVQETTVTEKDESKDKSQDESQEESKEESKEEPNKEPKNEPKDEPMNIKKDRKEPVVKSLGPVMTTKVLPEKRRKKRRVEEPVNPDEPICIKTYYSNVQKKKVWELLKTQNIYKVFDLVMRRIPFGTLLSWKKQINRGEPMVKQRTFKIQEFPELDEKVYEWFKGRRARQLPVRRKDIQDQAIKIAKELGVSQFKPTKGWANRFEEKNRLALRQRTRVTTRNSKDMITVVKKFYEDLNILIDAHEFTDIWNYDEVGIYFEPNISRTLDKKGTRNVGILSVKASCWKMTIVLLISASGLIAPPVLLFYNRMFQPFTVPGYEDILITSNQRGYNTEDTNYNEILPHFLKYIKEGSLFLFDECHAHRSERINKLLDDKQLKYMRFPGGTTCLLQPVDCNIGRIVKSEVKKCFMKWYLNSFEEITTPEGKRKKGFKRPTNRQMAEWVMTGVDKIRREDVISSFRSTGITSREMQRITIQEKVSRYFVNIDGILAASKVEPKEEPKDQIFPKENSESFDVPQKDEMKDEPSKSRIKSEAESHNY